MDAAVNARARAFVERINSGRHRLLTSASYDGAVLTARTAPLTYNNADIGCYDIAVTVDVDKKFKLDMPGNIEGTPPWRVTKVGGGFHPMMRDGYRVGCIVWRSEHTTMDNNHRLVQDDLVALHKSGHLPAMVELTVLFLGMNPLW